MRAAKLSILLCALEFAHLSLPAKAAAETAIFWISGPARVGQAVLVTGFFPRPEAISVKIWPIETSDGEWKAAPATATDARVINAAASSISFLLPTNGSSIFAFCVEEPGEPPVYARVNAPDVWWALGEASTSSALSGRIDANSVAIGGTLRIFGRCLTRSSTLPEVTVTPSSGSSSRLKVVASNPYEITAVVPSDLRSGRYRLSIRAIPQAPGTESNALDLQILDTADTTSATLNLQDFGAIGDGRFDNSASFAAAFSRASASRKTELLIPQGAYLLTKPLQIPAGIFLRGESPDLTMILFPDMETPPDSWIIGSRDFGLINLSVYCANHKAIVSSNLSGDPGSSGHIRIQNIRIEGNAFRNPATAEAIQVRSHRILQSSGQGFETLRLSGPDIVVEGSYLFGSSRPLWINRADGAIVRNNQIFDGYWGWYNFSNSQNLIIENNSVHGSDLLATGGTYGQGGSYMHSSNMYTAHNSYSTILGNNREAIVFDGGGSGFHGTVRTQKGNVLLLNGEANWRNADWHGAVAMITSGHGKGQWREVTAWTSTSVELGEPFVVAPDSTSVIDVVGAEVHQIFYQNHFEDVGISISFYGNTIDGIAAENDSVRAGGFAASSMDYFGIQPIMYLQFLQNEIKGGLNYMPEGGPGGAKATPSSIYIRCREGSIIGLVVRNNILGASAYVLIQRDSGTISDALVEGNITSDRKRGIQIYNCSAREVIVR